MLKFLQKLFHCFATKAGFFKCLQKAHSVEDLKFWIDSKSALNNFDAVVSQNRLTVRYMNSLSLNRIDNLFY